MTVKRVMDEAKGLMKMPVGSCGGTLKDKLLELGLDLGAIALGVVLKSKLEQKEASKNKTEDSEKSDKAE